METVVKSFDELTVKELHEIYRLRMEVFIVEQNCAYQDIDDIDISAYHIYLRDSGGICAYLRIMDRGVRFKDASIGRVITAPRKRGCGLGSLIMEEGIKAAHEIYNADVIRISAQLYAKEFYEKFGFYQVSDVYLEDGIKHIQMIRNRR